MNAPQPPARWRVIGIGSPVAQDDLGWAAIDLLRMAGLDASLDLLTLDRPGPALLEYLGRGEQVILIDAMQSGQPPGSVRDLALGELIASAGMPSTHALGLAETLRLAEALDALPERLHLLGIEMGMPGAENGWRAAALREVLRRIRALTECRAPE
ncbi:MAG TPA: hydrogenase maturation protease [Thioalkalivibrio sp.]|nr:hydrogenase maturation protease [Thioalkalivibrio sp.]